MPPVPPLILNLVLAEEIEDDAASITANDLDAAADEQEWRRIQHRAGKAANGAGGDEEEEVGGKGAGFQGRGGEDGGEKGLGFEGRDMLAAKT